MTIFDGKEEAKSDRNYSPESTLVVGTMGRLVQKYTAQNSNFKQWLLIAGHI
jgi:hypothetical protein